MTDNQTREVFDKLTKCVNGIQTLRDELALVKADIVEIKADVVEIKANVEGIKTSQLRMERQMEILARALGDLAGDSIQTKARVSILEETVN